MFWFSGAVTFWRFSGGFPPWLVTPSGSYTPAISKAAQFLQKEKSARRGNQWVSWNPLGPTGPTPFSSSRLPLEREPGRDSWQGHGAAGPYFLVASPKGRDAESQEAVKFEAAENHKKRQDYFGGGLEKGIILGWSHGSQSRTNVKK